MIDITQAALPDREHFNEYLERIYRSRRVTNFGPLVEELEKRLATYLGVDHVVLVANGTLALQIAYRLLNIRGSAVTTPFSFVATAGSLAWEGIEPIFSDIEEGTFNLDPTKIEKKLRSNSKALIPVHVFGNPCNVQAIQTIAQKHGLKVIYDASHAFGVKSKEGSLLNFGDVSTLSFHATKIFHTVEGGALIFKDSTLQDRAREMINFGFGANGVSQSLGINAKLSELHAAVGLCLLEDMEKTLQARRAVFDFYREALEKRVKFQSLNKEYTHNFSYCPVLFENERVTVRIWDALRKADIDSRRYFYPALHQLPYFRAPASLPVAENIAGRVLCLPLYPSLVGESLDRITKLILKHA